MILILVLFSIILITSLIHFSKLSLITLNWYLSWNVNSYFAVFNLELIDSSFSVPRCFNLLNKTSIDGGKIKIDKISELSIKLNILFAPITSISNKTFLPSLILFNKDSFGYTIFVTTIFNSFN